MKPNSWTVNWSWAELENLTCRSGLDGLHETKVCESCRSQVCGWYPFWNSDREQKGNSLQVHLMMEQYQGLYYCRVQYQRRNQTLNFTRSINVTAICEKPFLLTRVQTLQAVTVQVTSAFFYSQCPSHCPKSPASWTRQMTRSSPSKQVCEQTPRALFSRLCLCTFLLFVLQYSALQLRALEDVLEASMWRFQDEKDLHKLHEHLTVPAVTWRWQS